MAKKPDNRPQLRYEDRPELPETYADSVHGLFVSGQVMTIEFTVTRMDERSGANPPTGRKVPACRLVLPAHAAVDLATKLNQILAALNKAVATRTEDATAPAG